MVELRDKTISLEAQNLIACMDLSGLTPLERDLEITNGMIRYISALKIQWWWSRIKKQRSEKPLR